MNRKPLVLNAGETQQLQPADDLDIPLEERFAESQRKFRALLFWLAGDVGLDLPEEFHTDLELASKEQP